MKPKLLIDSLKTTTPEGIIIYSLVGYETAALTTNFFAGRRVIPPITEILGPLTHNKFGKIIAWLFLGWAFDHFYRNGEKSYIAKLELVVNNG